MAPISMADLKLKATKAKDAGLNTIQNTRDRYQSTPLAKTKFDPHGNNPNVEAVSSSRSSLSVPDSSVAHSTTSHSSHRPPSPRPDANKPVVPPFRRGGQSESKDVTRSVFSWANITDEDKEVLFSWLDEYFTRVLGFKVGNAGGMPALEATRHTARSSAYEMSPPVAPSVSARSLGSGPPPKIASWSKPKAALNPSTGANLFSASDFSTSYPPPSEHGSASLDLAYYFHPSTSWETKWYEGNGPPPPIKGSKNTRYLSSWESLGPKKTSYICVMFSDLSICWGIVKSTTDGRLESHSARYLPRPNPMSKPGLMQAAETYGEYVAVFAETHESSRQVCARGECWDLANEALNWFKDYPYIPEPVPSIGRTHGHLIFEGKASGLGKTAGRWRGGDDMIRRGDVVEWKKVKIGVLGGRPNSWAILGDPEHTAIIVSDTKPNGNPSDGQPFDPRDLVRLEVVEQSVGKVPARCVYDMKAFEEGEIWIYRPVGMEEYLGTLLAAKVPPTTQALSL